MAAEKPAITVLVTGIGNCGPGEGIAKALMMANADHQYERYHVLGADVEPKSGGLFRSRRGFLVPPARDPEYISVINEICSSNDVQIVIPGSEIEALELSRRAADINAFLLAHPHKTVAVCADSWETYSLLKSSGIQVPPSYLPESVPPPDFVFPAIVKGRSSVGSKNVFFAHDKAEADFFAKYLSRSGVPPMVQQYIGSDDAEYTTGLVTDQIGQVASLITLKRTLIAGATGTAEVVVEPRFDEMAEQVAATLELRGSLNIQFRIDDDIPVPFEVNPRFSGSTPIRAAFGVNEVDLSIAIFFLRQKVARPLIREGFAAMRVFRELYVPRAEIDDLVEHQRTAFQAVIHGDI